MYAVVDDEYGNLYSVGFEYENLEKRKINDTTGGSFHMIVNRDILTWGKGKLEVENFIGLYMHAPFWKQFKEYARIPPSPPNF